METGGGNFNAESAENHRGRRGREVAGTANRGHKL